MDRIFKALGDPTRRQILDLLRARDGRTVSDIESQVAMTRFGVMKHLGVLEEAGLIIPRRAGRFKYLHLNPLPLQQVMDRWVDPLVRPWARRIEDLRNQLEGPAAMTTTLWTMETFIRTTPDRLWSALTDPADTANYYFGSAVRSDWQAGAAIDYLWPDGRLMVGGQIITCDPPRKLVTTFIPHFGPTPGPATRVTYDLTPLGDVVRLTLTHEGLTDADQGIRSGWAKIISGLKSLLETGRPLPIPANA